MPRKSDSERLVAIAKPARPARSRGRNVVAPLCQPVPSEVRAFNQRMVRLFVEGLRNEVIASCRRNRNLAEADRQAVDRALRLLATNSRDPRLRAHELEGRERRACGYAYAGRIVFT